MDVFLSSTLDLAREPGTDSEEPGDTGLHQEHKTGTSPHQRQSASVVCLQVSSKHADRAISFMAKEEQRRILVEGHTPDDLPIGVMRSRLAQTAFKANLERRQMVVLVSLGLTIGRDDHTFRRARAGSRRQRLRRLG
jgi:hypothetical protein